MTWETIQTLLSVVGAVTGVAGAVTGGFALHFNRRDAARQRAKEAPTATLLLNPHQEETGWFVLKFTFDNVTRPFILTSAELRAPPHGKIEKRKASGLVQVPDGDAAQKIAVTWKINPSSPQGFPVGIEHLVLRLPEGRRPDVAAIRLKGNYLAGNQDALTIDCKGSV